MMNVQHFTFIHGIGQPKSTAARCREHKGSKQIVITLPAKVFKDVHDLFQCATGLKVRFQINSCHGFNPGDALNFITNMCQAVIGGATISVYTV